MPRVSDIDHFKCYRVLGRPFQTTVMVSDQFETQPTTLIEPRLICNPVDKNGEGIPDPDNHLTCYTIKPGAAFTPREVTTMDQFGQQELRSVRGQCRKRAFLCVPSEVNPPATTTSTIVTTTTTSVTTTT